MIKALILMNLVFFSFEIDHCLEVVPSCKKCITGYILFDSIDAKYCQKEEDSYNYDNIEHCLYSSGNTCYNCQSGYARTTNGRCKENSIHCDLFEGENCIKCENYYKLVEGICEKSTCNYFVDDECKCENGFYKNEKGGCSKIPIKFCEEGNATYCEECDSGYYTNKKGECSTIPIRFCYKGNDTYCEECYWKYEFNEASKECVLREGEEEEEYISRGGGNIKNCEEISSEDPTVCDECEENYDWDSVSKTCKYLCDGATEDLCYECNENYNSYDYGKTCEKIDPEYTSSDEEGENDAKYMNFDFAVLGGLLFLVI